MELYDSFSFLKNFQTVFHSTHTIITFPPRMYKGFFFSTSSPTLIICRLFDDSHSDQCEMVPHCGFDLHFADNGEDS